MSSICCCLIFIYSLPDVSEVNSSGDFLDKDRSQSVRSKLLMHTQEVNFGHLFLLVSDMYVDWDTSDETDHLLALLNSDTFKKILAHTIQRRKARYQRSSLGSSLEESKPISRIPWNNRI